MNDPVAVVMWVAILLILYAYAGYPVVLMLLGALKQLRADWRFVSRGATRRIPPANDAPEVAVLVAAYNEERHIAARVTNLLESDYPADRLRVYVGSDGSTDRTAALMARWAGNDRVRFMDYQERRGKPSVLNDLAALTDEAVLVFTDANTTFLPTTVRALVRHLDDPTVGCACGELRLVAPDASENQDHVYWRYERLLKFFESRMGALLGANGGVYALRRSDYQPIPSDAIVDDFWISMTVVRHGLRCVYDPEAVALEETPSKIEDEFRRRVRIGSGNYHALAHFRDLLHPRRGMLAFAFLSHKVLRWLVPHYMLIALLANAWLALRGDGILLLTAQAAFYLIAALGFVLGRRGGAPAPVRIVWFFVSMNLALLLGFIRFLSGRRTGTWARSTR
jgi:cellulose synthase/poly-beta-1,6-N-acetylglucosamine synthase-like glycosyltransferase